MQLGRIGLGKMGANMTTRLLQGGHSLHVTDLSEEAITLSVADGAQGAPDVPALIAQLETPRAVWVMVPAGRPTESVITQLADSLSPGDIVIDGGNSNYKDTMRRADALRQKEIQLVDVGTSGGVWGLAEGYSMMVGGDEQTVEHLRPIFETLAPAPDKGWGRVGPNGSGHFAKMIHNGIEYGMMQAFAEGFAIMRAKSEFGYDLSEVARIWQHGSVIRSWLLDLIKGALDVDEELANIAPYVMDSGEGRWTVFEAIDLNVSAPVITTALERRIRSREDGYTEKLIAMMRNAFGGHAVVKAEPKNE
jgi:6-phosphogluconate dehydrogenase